MSGDEGVSPVIGTILVLAITVVGIAALMVWGGPTLDRVQSQNAAFAMQGEFEGLRDASQDLSVPDHSRFPSVALPRGVLRLDAGTRFMVTANHDGDPAYRGCDLHVTGWAQAAATNVVTVYASGCRGPLTDDNFQVHSVAGATLSQVAVAVGGGPTYTITAPAATNFAVGDWRFRITDGQDTPTVYAQAWLHSSDRVRWDLVSGGGVRNLYLDGGAIFSQLDDSVFLAKAPQISDTSSGANYYGLWLRTFDSYGITGLDQSGTHQVFLALANNDLHVDEDTTYRLRFSFDGDLAQPWCNLLLQRNTDLANAGPAYVQRYAADPSATCAQGDAQGLRSVTFSDPSDPSDPTPFKLRFLHARIHASLVQ